MDISTDKNLSPTEIYKEEELGVVANYSVITVAFSSTFTIVTTFFTGIVISKYNGTDPFVNIPILFLIISTFGFLFATLIYANNAGHLLRINWTKFRQSRLLGNVLSEYLGVYFLMLSIPLIINVISKDPFLKTATFLIDLGGLFVYHLSGFSIMQRHYKHTHLLLLTIIYILELGLALYQYADTVYFQITASILILFIFGLAFFARRETI